MTRILLALFALLSICHAQSGPARSSVSGRVLDPTRTPVVGAKVSAIPEGSSTGPTVMTDQGRIIFHLSLDAGKYSLKVSKEGFADATQAWSKSLVRPLSNTTFRCKSHQCGRR